MAAPPGVGVEDLPNEDHVDGGVDSSSLEEVQGSIGVAWALCYVALAAAVCVCGLLILVRLVVRCRRAWKLRHWGMHQMSVSPVVVGFFHPYCHAGGGGERVLWQSISALQQRYNFVQCVIYAGFESNLKPTQILNKVQEQFGIALCGEVEFVYLHRRQWVEPRCWPRLTILGQSFGSVVLGLEALLKFSPHVFVDTTGYAFVIPLFKWLGGCKTISYVHYPTVSQDMLEKVKMSESSYNNSTTISQSRWLTNLKLLYYRLYAKLYGFAGRRNDIVMVNSTWTHGHISKIWGAKRLYIVYPPCDTSTFQQLPIHRSTKKFSIISIGQFRPEKDHYLQLCILRDFLKELEPKEKKLVQLVMVGSCRNSEDSGLVKELRQQAKSLGIERYVQFEINIPFGRLKELLGTGSAALHTMWNEHFGIGLVECMAAGCVMVGHDSGGPRMDIVTDWKGHRTGLLAASLEHYVSCLLEVFHMSGGDRSRLVSSARESVRTKFAVEVFEASFLRATEHLFT